MNAVSEQRAIFIIAQAPSTYRIHQAQRMAEAFQPASVHLVYLRRSPPQGYELLDGAHGVHEHIVSNLSAPIRAVRLALLLREFRPAATIVAGHAGLDRAVARLLGRRYGSVALFSDSNVFGIRAAGVRYTLRRMLVVASARSSKLVLVCGTAGAAFYAIQGVDPGKIRFMPHLTSRAVWHESERFRNSSPSRQGRRLLYAGRLAPEKRVTQIVTSFASSSLPSQGWTLRIVGTGDQEAAIRLAGDAAQLDGHLEIVPFATADELAQEYAHASALVLNSAHEPWGVVVVEALAMGLPVLAPWNAGSAELLASFPSGLVFNPSSGQYLTTALDLLPSLDLEALSQVARKTYVELESREMRFSPLRELLDG